MDDDIVLNFATEDVVKSKAGQGQKGGRWTDR